MNTYFYVNSVHDSWMYFWKIDSPLIDYLTFCMGMKIYRVNDVIDDAECYLLTGTCTIYQNWLLPLPR